MGIIIICVLVVIFLLLWAIVDIVPQSEARVMERLGIFREVWGAGIHLKFPILDRCAVKVDLREQVMELPKVSNRGDSHSVNSRNSLYGFNKGYNRGIGAGADAGAEGATTGFGAAVGNILTNLFVSSDKSKYSSDANHNVIEHRSFSDYSDFQGVITKDNVVMDVDAAVFFQITDPKMYAYGMKQPRFALQKLTITTLRNIFGTLDLDETLTSRELINSKLRATLDEATDNWGIKITRVEIEEIKPPHGVQEAMHEQAIAERKRRATILHAEGVAERNRLMNETAPNEAVLRMLAIQAMPEITNGQSNTVIIPSEIQNVVSLAKTITEVAPINTKPAN